MRTIAPNILLLKLHECLGFPDLCVCVQSDRRAARALVNGRAPRVKSTYPSSARASTATMVTAAPRRSLLTVSVKRYCSMVGGHAMYSMSSVKCRISHHIK